MPEMLASRAHVFRPLIKGNKALGMRLGFTEQLAAFTRAQSAILQSGIFNLHVERARKIPYSRS